MQKYFMMAFARLAAVSKESEDFHFTVLKE